MERAERTVGLVFDDRYLQHDTGLWLYGDEERERFPFADPVPHPSSPALVGRAKHLLDLYDLTARMDRIAPLLADDAALLTYHTADYLRRVAALAAGSGGDTGAGAPIGRGGDRIARLAAGGTMAAIEAVVRGHHRAVYALVRPPGHHAMADRGMGFCIYNNAVVAVRYAQQCLGVNKVAVLDWDVHHGNGTQDAFWRDDQVLFLSLHQDDLYPTGWGAAEATGEADGQGFTVNVPLPAGTGNAGYAAAFERIVVPIIEAFSPELIVISAGQDANVQDPLARMAVTVDGYRSMTRSVVALADRCCEGRLVVTQEGGYASNYAPYCSAAIAEVLLGPDAAGCPPVDEPYGARAETLPPSRTVGLDCEHALERVATIQRAFWPV